MSGSLFRPPPMAPPLDYRVDLLPCAELLARIEDESVDLVLVDPAYPSLEKHRAKGTTTRLKVSDASSNAWFEVQSWADLRVLVREVFRVLRPARHCYVICDDETSVWMRREAWAAGFYVWPALTWVKTGPAPAVPAVSAPEVETVEVDDEMRLRIGMGYHYRQTTERVVFLEKREGKVPKDRGDGIEAVPDPWGKGRQLTNLGIPNALHVNAVRGVQTEPACVCEDTRHAWEIEDRARQTRSDTGRSTPRGTTRSGSEVVSDLPTSSSGNGTTDPFPPDTRSTTSTRTSSTTQSGTSFSSIGQRTSGSTPDASSSTGCGGSPVDGAGSSSRSPSSTGTSTPTGDGLASAGVVRAGSGSSSSGSGLVRRCGRCGRPDQPVSHDSWPTEKPVELLEVLIRQSTEPGELVLDPCCGSGSAGEAALVSGRRVWLGDRSREAVSRSTARCDRARAAGVREGWPARFAPRDER